jgi:eukaryotic-like serine/threonine-protein kinase
MAATHAATLNQLLDTALQLPAEQRAQWLEQLGPEYDPVKARLRKLIARSLQPAPHQAALGTLPKLAETRDAPGAVCLRTEGSRLGPYRLVRRLGIGGMGVVWLAEHEYAVTESLVALKFAHTRPDRTDLPARLQRERKLLASLQHPNIARLYDAGVTEDERLYLVLEYVEGVPLDQYCQMRQATLAQRLAVFVQVADAMVHAHDRRIVHRDLKPANVLVTKDGETKLLDFGVAKLLGDEGFSQMQLSRMTGMPLTPEYASPEQIQGQDVGLSSDIYSLGVMLFELVTGVRPYACARGSNRALREAIVESVPLRPSEVATDPEVGKLLAGPLDAVILKALAKRPEDRHASMQEFAAEIEAQARRLTRERELV